MSPHISWPAERFFWSVLEVPGITRPRALASEMISMLEDDVPLDSERLHAVAAPLKSGQIVVCSIDASSLRELPVQTLSLTPANLPHFLQGRGVSAQNFNLLVGAFEPPSLRMARVRRRTHMAAVIAIGALIIAIGAHRRATHWRDLSKTASATHAALLAIDSADRSPNALQAQEQQLTSIKNILDSTPKPADASLSLADVLDRWPSDAAAVPQSIAANQAGVALSLTTGADPSQFLNSLHAPHGWQLDEPRIITAGGATRITIHLRPTIEDRRAP